MRLVEASKFKKQRKKIRETQEKNALKKAIFHLMENPESGKKLKGEFKDLRALSYTVKGQSRRLIYRLEKNALVLLSFGPREGVYK
jgi:mRNA-degrading endonuclease YafQ of YafQ-DinJ toxin-antitoxin module